MSLQTFFDNFAVLADAPNGVAKLRELILRLAVRGKLVPQNPNDESVTILVKNILKEKIRLAKNKKIRKADLSKPIQQAEIPYSLPDTWIWQRVEDVFHSISPSQNKIKSSEVKEAGKFPVIDQGQRYVAGFVDDESKLIRIPGPVIIFGDHTCELKFVDFDFVAGADGVKILRPIQIYEAYFFRVTQTFEVAERGYSRHYRFFLDNLFPLPPLEEQKRIVAKVDELMLLCEELEARQQARRESRVRLNNATLAPLNKAASLAPEEFEQASARLADNFGALYDSAETVGKLRSTILQLAVQGKLVPQDCKEESATYLLDKTLAARKKLWMNKETGKKERLGRNQDLQVIASKYLEPSNPTVKNPSILPTGWTWCSLEQISEHIVDGTHHTPTYVEDGIPFISAKNIVNGEIEFNGCRNISEDEYKQLIQRCNPQMGDILVTKSGSIGRVAVVKTHNKFTLFESVALIPIIGEISRTYISTAIYLSASGKFGAENQKGMAVRHLHLKDLRQMPLALPPLEEQKRIVAKVNQLMTLCDELETKLRQTEADSEKLMRAAVRDSLASVGRGEIEEALSSAV